MSKSNKFAIICNSSNPDFESYFKGLVNNLEDGRFLFAANKWVVKKIDPDNKYINTHRGIGYSLIL